VDELHPVDLPFPFGLDLMLGAKVAVDDRRVAERTAVVMNGDGVVGGVHEIVEIGNPRAGHGHQGNGDLTVVNGGRSQHAGDGDLAASDVDMQLVADPGFLVALAVFLGADIAGGGQLTFCVVCRSSRVGSGFGRCSSLRGRPRLRVGRAPSGGGGSSCLSFVSFLAGLSRASISVASRAITPTMRPPSERSINAACILSGKSPCANSAKARENVASEGTCARRSQPRMRRSDLSTSRRSIRALVVGTPSIALATKALARARRSAGGRPGPRGGPATKASRPITSRVVTRRPSASVIGSTSSRSQGNRVPWIWFQRAFMASRGSVVMPVIANQEDGIKTIFQHPLKTRRNILRYIT